VTRVLLDTNVVLDVVLVRHPHFLASTAVVDAVGDARVDGLVAGHAITTVAYLLQRERGSARTRSTLAHLLSQIRVAAVTDEAVRLALSAPMSDFEDAVTAMVANEANADVIVTRDASGFLGSPVPAVLPETFLASL
jgi:predicted nucleic acid-binding protein